MKNLVSKILVLVVVASSVTACGLRGSQRDTATGAVLSGVAGGLIGGNTTSTVVGAAVGGLVGSQWNR